MTTRWRFVRVVFSIVLVVLSIIVFFLTGDLLHWWFGGDTMTESRWLLVEHCASFPPLEPTPWTHRLHLTPAGEPSLDHRSHLLESQMPVESIATMITLAGIAHEPVRACLVVKSWLEEHPEIARLWVESLYRPAEMALVFRRHVRLCAWCNQPIATLSAGYSTGSWFCGQGCRVRARRAGKTVHELNRVRLQGLGYM